jgi:hypothetical protein
MSFLGSWKIDDNLIFPAITHRFDTGALTDADAVPAYRVYEDETSTAILTGNMAKLDDTNTTGFYSEQIALSAANGFEKGKCYTVYITAAVNSVTGGQHHTFQIEAEVDSNTVSDKTGYGISGLTVTNLQKATAAIGRGTVTTGGSTTSVPTSAFSPAGAVADQFKGRTILFDGDTTTTALRGQSRNITASSNAATPTLTVDALTTAPSSGDTFSVI